MESVQAGAHDVLPFLLKGRGEGVSRSGGRRQDKGDASVEDREELVEVVELGKKPGDEAFVERLATAVSCECVRARRARCGENDALPVILFEHSRDRKSVV